MRSPPHRGHWFNMAGSPNVRVSCSAGAFYSASTVQFSCVCVLSTSSGISTGLLESDGLRRHHKPPSAHCKLVLSRKPRRLRCLCSRMGHSVWCKWCILWFACTCKGNVEKKCRQQSRLASSDGLKTFLELVKLLNKLPTQSEKKRKRKHV